MESLFSKDTLTYKKKIVYNAGVEAVLDYYANKKNHTTEIQLLFSPFGLPFVPIEVVGTNVNKIITNLTWTKDRANPGGILSCTLSPDARVVKEMVDIINKFTGNLYSRIWGSLGVDLEDLFKPMSLCQLWINGYHVLTGTVRACSRSTSVDNTSKNVSYNLIIEELGNLYNMNTISMDLITQDGLQQQILDSIQTALSAVGTLKAVSVATAIQTILEAFKLTTLTQGMNLSDGFPLSLRLRAERSPVGGIGNLSIAESLTVDANMFQMHSSGGGQQSIWSYLKNFIPNPWMEFFTESGGRTIVTDTVGVPAVLFPGFNYIVSRTVPYSNPLLGTVHPRFYANTLIYDLNALSLVAGGDFIIITDDIISDKTIGVDSVNQATVFHTLYTSGGVINAPDKKDKGIKCAGPLNPFASGGIGTFGIREMFQTIDCTTLQGFGYSTGIIERLAKNIQSQAGVLAKPELSNLLATWFRNQSRFREGNVVVKGMPYARPGMYCLYLPSLSGKKPENIRDIGIYYIDSLTHNYEIDNNNISYTTNLNLIRGVPIPTSIATTALLLFDYELLPPQSGLWDGEYLALKAAREAIAQI